MAKIVRDDFAFIVQWAFDEEAGETIVSYSTRYTVESEGVVESRTTPVLAHDAENENGLPQFSSQQETQIFNFIKNVVFPKVKEHEGV